MNVAVIGSGTMGNGIAHVFAQHGFSVALIDISQLALDRALGTITKNLDRQVSKATLSEDDKGVTLGRLRTFTSLQEGVANAGLVVEAATENVDLKLQIFRDLDQFARPMPFWRPIPRPSPSRRLPPLPSARSR